MTVSSLNPGFQSRWLKLGGLVPFALVLVGCGGTGDPGSTPTIDPFQTGIIVDIPTSQHAPLADRHVTWEEYEAAFFAYVTCLDDNGVPHREPELLDRRHPPGWTLSIGPFHIDQSDEVRRQSEECWHEHYAAVDAAWQLQEAPTHQEWQQLEQQVVECVNERTDLALTSFSEVGEALLVQQYSGTVIACQALVFQGTGPYAGN